MPDAVALEQTVLVAGHPRSGTSLICRLLDTAGVTFPTDVEADRYNRDGYYELLESKELSKALIDEAMTDKNTATMNTIVRELNSCTGWGGLKLVRVPALFFYLHVAKNLKLIGVFRHPADVKASQFRRGISSFTPGWFQNNNALIAAYENVGDALLISYERLLAKPEEVCHRMKAFGFDVRTDRVDTTEATQTDSDLVVRPHQRKLYDRLRSIEARTVDDP